MVHDHGLERGSCNSSFVPRSFVVTKSLAENRDIFRQRTFNGERTKTLATTSEKRVRCENQVVERVSVGLSYARSG
jgi:hypothetical protein